MKRVFSLLVVVACSLRAATPTLLQHVNGSLLRPLSTANPSGSVFTLWLADPTKAGNCVIVGMTHDSGTTISSVVDDQSDSFTQGQSVTNATDGQTVEIWYKANVAAGARQITVTQSSATYYTAIDISEFNNIATVSPLDGHNGKAATTASTTVTANAVTPTATGDLVYQYTFRSGSIPATSFTAGSQSNITWQLAHADLLDGNTAQWGVYNSTAALTPTHTMAASSTYESAAIFLKAATAGSPASGGIRVQTILHEDLPSGWATPAKFQVPTSGNLIVAAWCSGAGTKITGITSTPTNTWTDSGVDATQTGGGGSECQFFYVANATSANTLTTTVTTSNNTQDATILFYDIVGAATSPFDTTSTFDGNEPSGSANLTGLSITPTTTNGLVLAEVGIGDNHIVNTANTSQFFDAHYYNDGTFSGGEPIDENNGWAHVYNGTTSPLSFGWVLGQSIPALKWDAAAIAFKAPVSSGATPVTGPLVGAGIS